jgi:signal transduction histidine kinase
MSRFLPSSLFGQTLLILLAGLIVSHAVGSWIYTADREQAVRAVGGFAAAQRIANLTRLVQDAPREWRQRIVTASSDQMFRVSISAKAAALGASETPVGEAIRSFLVDQLGLAADRQPVVSVSLVEGDAFDHPHVMMGRGPKMGGGPMMMHAGFRSLAVAVPLADGGWLDFVTALPEPGAAPSRQLLVSMAFMAVIILGVSIWAVRRVTAPLASLSAAAERLGADLNAPSMAETGSVEMQRAARAFNTMQTKLRGLIENRTRLLAAISHDLRTPLTLLRLRAENVGDAAERDKMLSTIADMDSMVGATLLFARDEAAREAPRPTDIAALTQSVVDDMSDAGMPVKMEHAESIVLSCRPEALRRAFRNLLDNAVKYGKSANVQIVSSPNAVEIDIDDEGPGIPEHELARVMQPFYRAENSRSRETGGIGLGLSITQSIVQTAGGELILMNRPQGGLRASVKLPRQVPSVA